MKNIENLHLKLKFDITFIVL